MQRQRAAQASYCTAVLLFAQCHSSLSSVVGVLYAADLLDLPAATVQQSHSRDGLLSKLWQMSRAAQSRRECLPLCSSALTASCAAVAKLTTQSRQGPEMRRGVASCRAYLCLFSPVTTRYSAGQTKGTAVPIMTLNRPLNLLRLKLQACFNVMTWRHAATGVSGQV